MTRPEILLFYLKEATVIKQKLRVFFPRSENLDSNSGFAEIKYCGSLGSLHFSSTKCGFHTHFKEQNKCNKDSVNLRLALIRVALLKANFEISLKTSCIQRQEEGCILFKSLDKVVKYCNLVLLANCYKPVNIKNHWLLVAA